MPKHSIYLKSWTYQNLTEKNKLQPNILHLIKIKPQLLHENKNILQQISAMTIISHKDKKTYIHQFSKYLTHTHTHFKIVF